MKIKYTWFDEPNKEKVYDTEKALKNNPFIKRTQSDFDKMELESMERKKQQGLVLSYEIAQ